MGEFAGAFVKVLPAGYLWFAGGSVGFGTERAPGRVLVLGHARILPLSEDRFVVDRPDYAARASAAWPLPRGVEWRGLCVPQEPSGGPTGWVVIPSAISTT